MGRVVVDRARSYTMPARPSRSARKPVPPPATDRQVAESGGDWFEEASDHAVAAAGAAGFRFGPVSPLPGAAVEPGVFGWQRPIQGASVGTRGTAVLYYLAGNSVPKPKGASPIREFDWSEFAAVERCQQPVAGCILARGPVTARAALRGLVGDVCRELARPDE
jgi:hypothetical protein